MVADENPGWWRITPAAELTALSEGLLEDGADIENRSRVITALIPVEHAELSQVQSLIQPFLTRPGGSLIALEASGVLIVTDFADRVTRAQRLATLADQPGEPIRVELLPATHLRASVLASQVNTMLQTQARMQGRDDSMIEVGFVDRTNQLVLTGSADRVAEAIRVAGSLDVPLGVSTRTYQMAVVSPQRVDSLIRSLIDPIDLDRIYRSSVDEELGWLVVSTTPDIHAEITTIRNELDVRVEGDRDPVRFYRLRNAGADEVLRTIQAITPSTGLDTVALDGATPSEDNLDPNTPAAISGVTSTIDGHTATLAADINTNSIIVIAPPATQQIYAKLIERLDERRPQVLIEVTVVTLDTSDGYSVGVDISRSETNDAGQILTFSSFGLSSVDLATGGLELIPGVGFNGALLGSDIADVVVRAVQSDSRAEVVAAPSLLVNDNAEGLIVSESEAPTTSINQGQNSDTVSFSGFVGAGTTVSVQPRISEGDHLALTYSIELSTFDGESGEGIPPPRQTNSVSSEVTIPNGWTIVLGGINRKDTSESVQRVPLLGRIPGVEYLFSNRTVSESETTLFVFIKATILRDDTFADLRHISGHHLESAGVPGDWPTSEPMTLP